MARRLWTKLNTPIGEVRVYAQTRVIDEDGCDCHAQYLADKRIIEVQWSNPELMKKHLFHELVHHCFEGINDLTWTAMFGSVPDDQVGNCEEEVADFFEEKMYDLLTRNGLLKIPNPPKLA